MVLTLASIIVKDNLKRNITITEKAVISQR